MREDMPPFPWRHIGDGGASLRGRFDAVRNLIILWFLRLSSSGTELAVDAGEGRLGKHDERDGDTVGDVLWSGLCDGVRLSWSRAGFLLRRAGRDGIGRRGMVELT